MNRTTRASTISALLATSVFAVAGCGGNAGAEKPHAPSTVENAAPKAEPVDTGPVPAKDRATTPADAIRPTPAKDPGTPVVEAVKSSPTAAVDHPLLETIGTVTAAHYYQTYLNVGFIADGKAKQTYADKEARELLAAVLSLLNSVDRQLEALGQRNLAKDDRDSLEQMRAISALLRQQGKQLQTFWDTALDQDAASYENLRQKSWAAINKLMGGGQ
jgi:hypothetical protein